MKDKPLRALIVDDSEDDVLLIIRELKKGGYIPAFERVETAPAMKQALTDKLWDIILCDYKMPHFSAPSAIALLKESGIDIPIIIISGAIGEETAVECMRLGAQDYIMKDNFSRLCPVIERELEEAGIRQKKNQAEKERSRLIAIMERTTDLIATALPDGQLTYINSAGRRMLGIGPDEDLSGFKFWDAHPAWARQIVMNEGVPDAIKNGVWQGETAMLSRDGMEIPVSQVIMIHTSPDGNINYISTIIRDITERKKAELALRDREQRLSLIINSFPGGVAQLDRDFRYLFINKQYEQVCGLAPDSVIGRTVAEVLGEELFGRLQPFFKQVLDGEMVTMESQIKNRAGEILYGLDTYMPYLNPDGTVRGFILTVIDITGRKKDAMKIQFLANVVESSDDAIITKSLGGMITSWNKGAESIYGYGASEVIGRNISMLAPPRLKDEIKHLTEKIKRGEHVTHFETVRVRKDGTRINVSLTLSPVFDASGNLIGASIIARDITRRRQVEEALKESEVRFKAQYHGSPIPTFTWQKIGADFVLKELNEAALLVTQGVAKKFINKTAREMYHNHQDVLRDMQKCFEKKTVIKKELRSKHFLPGRDIVTTFAFVPDDLVMVHVEDITERKQAEEKLQRTLESFKKAVGTTIQVLVSVLEARDPYTSGHQSRAAHLACAIAEEMGFSQDKIEGIRMAGSIHDIGKLSIPAEILVKPTKLTNLEYSLIKEHPKAGYEMLRDVESPWPLAQIVYQHHERMDGTGYPGHLKGEEIIPEARIMAVADVVEAMASHRPYRASLGIEPALEEIEKNKGILYDAAVVDACLKLFREKGYQLTKKI